MALGKAASITALDSLRLIVPGRLAFVSTEPSQFEDLKNDLKGHAVRFMSSALHLQYLPMAADFGPVNLGIVHRFCNCLSHTLLHDESNTILYCIQDSFEAQANASFLLGVFMMVHFGWSPEKAAAPFSCSTSPFTLRPFRDATLAAPTYTISLMDCLQGFSRAVELGWYRKETFDAQLYTDLDNSFVGDIHQICPKFVAMKGPMSINSKRIMTGEFACPPELYVPILLHLGVTCVIRLNEPDTYDKRVFERAGIAHHDLFFDDCTTPPDDVVERFLDICDREERVAVHCRAGLGRTGTLIALWLMKHAGFGADEAIGWLRIVRPGSVIGPQQQYLKACEGRRWSGNTLRPADCCLHSESDVVAPDELAAQVAAGMCARSAAKVAAAAAAAASLRSFYAGSRVFPAH